MPTSMGRSYTVPAFRRSAGARFTVMRETGKRKPQFFTAERTRSRASFTAVSGRPTTSKAGRPLERSHSAVTSYPVTPWRPSERTLQNMVPPVSFPVGWGASGRKEWPEQKNKNDQFTLSEVISPSYT